MAYGIRGGHPAAGEWPLGWIGTLRGAAFL